MESQNQTQFENTMQEEAPAMRDTSPTASSPVDRRESVEWDASKVPPSRFQKRKGSIYAVPASRDGHVENNYASKYHEKLAEKGWGGRKKSVSSN
ncbi:hypothetical protein UCRPA7_558 [Phaeoacremonium minimum UCRPA7]|uniref:Uncharacterized protein n=1 Tax=Phaeoacremonium minimum (strain UCR-PA7) TaxID=1286976 RepID=R8BWR5_PHAM7|nr:hypothetical protein UCRPA7_558 [Phaeoacremonium minimum UCRPA7]EOO03775.1 hypothetical protein UCRPA7_558 [Phaeoacremonium minimum UCRPA7]